MNYIVFDKRSSVDACRYLCVVIEYTLKSRRTPTVWHTQPSDRQKTFLKGPIRTLNQPSTSRQTLGALTTYRGSSIPVLRWRCSLQKSGPASPAFAHQRHRPQLLSILPVSFRKSPFERTMVAPCEHLKLATNSMGPAMRVSIKMLRSVVLLGLGGHWSSSIPEHILAVNVASAVPESAHIAIGHITLLSSKTSSQSCVRVFARCSSNATMTGSAIDNRLEARCSYAKCLSIVPFRTERP